MKTRLFTNSLYRSLGKRIHANRVKETEESTTADYGAGGGGDTYSEKDSEFMKLKT